MSLQVHWHEGLFLQPHHFQMHQRLVQDQIHSLRQLGWNYPYGVVEARLAQGDLENMRVRFEKLSVVMPSGLLLRFPENAELPSINIQQPLAKTPSLKLFLGVPLWLKDRANVFRPDQEPDSRVKLLFQLKEIEWRDENTGDNPRAVLTRRVNARLMLEHEDSSDMELIPLLRITRSVGEEVGTPKQDREYVPPLLVLSGSPVLREMVRELAAQVEASRKELALQLGKGGFSLDTLRGVQFEQMLRLRTLNRFSASLPALAQAPSVPPFAMYLQLRELLAELASLYPDRDAFESAPYQHDDPYPGFNELIAKIRGLLRGAVAPSFIKVPFTDADGMRIALLEEDHFVRPNAWFLAVKSKADPIALARYVENGDQFKFMPKSLAMAAIYGIQLKEERYPPLELPAQPDLHYFRLLTTESGRRWEQIRTEKAAVLDCKGSELDLSGAEFALYMTVPNT